MKKCCDSCRFYQKGSLGGSGWCRHPERIEAQSDLVLVRSSQLACRKGWDQDSWEAIPRNGGERDRREHRHDLGPVPPVTPAEFTAVFPPGRQGEPDTAREHWSDVDRVVGAMPSPMRQIPKALLPRPTAPIERADVPAEDGVKSPDTRETIRRAREVQRARASNRMRPTVDPLPSSNGVHSGADGPAPIPPAPVKPEMPAGPPVASASPPKVAGSDDVIDHGPIEKIPEPVMGKSESQLVSRSSSFIDVTIAPPRPPRRPFIPDPHERDLPPPALWLIRGMKTQPVADPAVEPVRLESASHIDGGNDVVVSDDIFEIHEDDDAQFPEVRVGDQGPTQREHATRKSPRKQRTPAFSLRNRWSEARRWPAEEIDVASRALELSSPDTTSRAAPELQDDAGWYGEDEPDPERVAQYGALPDLDDYLVREIATTTAASNVASWDDHDIPGAADYESPAFGDAGIPNAPVPMENDVVVYDGIGPIVFDPTIDAYVIAPDVPRMCQTCSAFRPADGGTHGWCSNGWAFDNRRFVGGSGVPCASSIGDWWLPSDAYWDDGLLERLGTPTPYYDREIAPRFSPPRQRSVPRRRRR